MPLEKLKEVVAQNHTEIGVITASSDAAQDIADSLVKAGVQAILNFAPVHLSVPPTVQLRNVDLAVNLEVLTFHLGTDKQENSFARVLNFAK